MLFLLLPYRFLTTRMCFTSCLPWRATGALFIGCALTACALFVPNTPSEEAHKQCRNEPLLGTEQGIKATIETSRDNLKKSVGFDFSTYQRYAAQLAGYDAKFEQVYQVTRTACVNWLGCRIRTERERTDTTVCDGYFAQYREIQNDLSGLIGEIQTKAQDVQKIASKGGAETKTAPVALPTTGEEVVGFSGVDTGGRPGSRVAAAPYLHDYGISVGELKPTGSQLVLVDNLGLYEGKAVRPTYSQVFLTQAETGSGAASFTLIFNKSVRSLTITRPMLYAETNSGVTHPAWSAHAFDETGHELALASEGLTRSFSTVPAQAYSLVATGFNGIKSVRFDSDFRLNGVSFAGFSAVLIERITTIPFDKQ